MNLIVLYGKNFGLGNVKEDNIEGQIEFGA